jgi:aspartate/tyrosine/aromatic aminotransferase
VAFLGFTTGLDEDLAGLRQFCRPGLELLIATSLSKSFALYNERVGAFSVVGSTQEAALNVYSHVRHLIRANYSNPPLRGAAIVTEILNDPELYRMWQHDIQNIRRRIRSVRAQLVQRLRAKGVMRDLSYITRERGLFTSLDLTKEQIDTLRDQHGIHMSPAGRFNVTAMTDEQLDKFCQVVRDYL